MMLYKKIVLPLRFIVPATKRSKSNYNQYIARHSVDEMWKLKELDVKGLS